MVNKKILEFVPLASKVLVVAVRGEAKDDWSAYISPVPGVDHEKEVDEVASKGSKISKELAEFLFPKVAEKYVWRN